MVYHMLPDIDIKFTRVETENRNQEKIQKTFCITLYSERELVFRPIVECLFIDNIII